MGQDLVEAMPCADGKRRAEPIAFGLYSTNGEGGALSSGLQALTAATTLKQSDNGRGFSNSGAAGSVTATLPTPFPGMMLLFVKKTNQTFVIAAAANTTVNGSATYTNSSNETASAFLQLYGISATEWLVVGKVGTWAIA